MSANLTNQAFCVLPFIEKFQNLNGKKYLCCHSNVPVESQDLSKIQQDILNGIKIPQCNKCYQLESNNVISPRQRESARWLKNLEVKEYVENWNPDDTPITFFYDVRYDNKCNLACISCNPGASSLWARELGIESTNHELDFNLDELLGAKKLYLAGGEPLIIDNFIRLIKDIAELDQQPELVINTNLTSVTDELKQSLLKIKNLTLTVSIDAYKSVNEYHRWPMRWDKLFNNLIWVRDNIKCNIQVNSVVDAVSILNIDQLVAIEYLLDQWTLSILTTPTSLLIQNLPEHLKKTTAENFSNIKQSKFYTTDPIFKTTVDQVLVEIFKPGHSELLSMFIKQLDQRRNINHKTYLGVDLT
jgi:sulfatase maturation enzyme AslB (radical SAM superfamily)